MIDLFKYKWLSDILQMTVVQDIFDAFTLDRMIMEFSWTKIVDDSDKNGKEDFIYGKYHDIFLNPDFIIKKGINSPFVQIDIRKLHQALSKSIPINDEGFLPPMINPKSLDYLDNRLHNTPSDIHKQILDIKKLDHKCFVSFYDSKVLFDCNYEQLTLIMRILEDSLQFHPLILKQNHFNHSSQIILPWFNTHSYSFSFEFSKGLNKLFGGSEIEDVLIGLLREITSIDKVRLYETYQLSGFEGIFVTIRKTNDAAPWMIQYDVSNLFTKSLMLLDRSAIQKTSLWFFNELLKCIKGSKINNALNFSRLMDELSTYII
ncbi:MAG: hypothetical protein HeimC2_46120 [Candidatus Heimdallarchaeota archaeon LC_2]|nr:MAG: hypothetical protein HeimC2_46120 [Candidatus Heimdallarchaeota archaeon LC_2]